MRAHFAFAGGGIHFQEAEKQKPNALELLGHFKQVVLEKMIFDAQASRRDLLERSIKEYNATVKVKRHQALYAWMQT